MPPTVASRPIITALAACGVAADEILRDQEVQPLVYLLQGAGAPLAYRFTWEEIGPFSVTLAAETHELLRELPANGTIEDADPGIADAVAAIQPLLEPPGEDIARPAWLHLLMCVDFLRRRAQRPVLNGERPAVLTANFTDAEIGAAKTRLDGVSAHASNR
jgi:hypothetical protein